MSLVNLRIFKFGVYTFKEVVSRDGTIALSYLTLDTAALQCTLKANIYY